MSDRQWRLLRFFCKIKPMGIMLWVCCWCIHGHTQSSDGIRESRYRDASRAGFVTQRSESDELAQRRAAADAFLRSPDTTANTARQSHPARSPAQQQAPAGRLNPQAEQPARRRPPDRQGGDQAALEQIRQAARQRMQQQRPAQTSPGRGASTVTVTGQGGRATSGVVTMFLFPIEQVVEFGRDETVKFAIKIDNPEDKDFDTVSFRLKFDPSVLQAVDQVEGPRMPGINIKDRHTAFGLDPYAFDPVYYNQVDNERGLIQYRGKLSPFHLKGDNKRVVAVLEFRVLAPTSFSPITFSFKPMESLVENDNTYDYEDESDFEDHLPDDWTYLVNANGEDMLGDPSVPQDGVVSGGVVVVDTGESDLSSMAQRRRRHIPRGSVQLRLNPSRIVVEEDEIFDVGVFLDNPEYLLFDNIRMVLSYNPEALEVIDYDHDPNLDTDYWNLITSGINIFDRQFKDNFPFDSFFTNQANPRNGTITYHVKRRSQGLRSDGQFSTIRFRARAPVQRTTINFVFGRDGKETRVTHITTDLLGTQTQGDGAQGAAVTIAPRGSLHPEETRPLRTSEPMREMVRLAPQREHMSESITTYNLR